ncbi:MAG TPA: VWA domain-containing protein [Pyrinomonadaceae bacterium]|nr:VWA domain-containing protein [Pyrinomonadaceae bacterium]
MKKAASVATSVAAGCALVLSLIASGKSQQPAARPTPEPSPLSQNAPSADEEVVRITTNLVQVDAVVTDKEGRVVTDLRAEDFELLEDGRPQTITNLSFIPLEPAIAAGARDASLAPAAKDKNAPPAPAAPPTRLRPEQVRRTMALVAGNLSFGTADAVHDALKKYVDEQVQPNDLVAIISLFGSGGALQQFTTDKRQLVRAVGKVRWLPSSGLDADDVEAARRDDTYKMRPGGAGGFESAETRATRERIDSTVGPFCQRVAAPVIALTHLVRRMRSLPGRKSVIYFSNGLSIGLGRGQGDLSLCVYNALRQLVDTAARSSVVINTIDARGVVNPYHISAQDDVAPGDTSALRAGRGAAFFESQNGLNFMAENTGGHFIHSKNDLNLALRRVFEDERGYYLIGYRPTEDTFKGKRFHDIKVRVRRPGLKVRSRSGFFSLPDGGETVPKTQGSGDRQLIAALASPVGGADVRVQLTSFFGNDPRAGSFVRSLLHINAQDITFTDEPNNFKKVVLDAAAVTIGEDGRIADEFNRTHTVRIGPDTFRHIMLHGLSYSADVPVKRAGAYQLRIVVRDAASGRMGASGQFIEVPDVRNKQFALSGLVLGEAVANGSPTLPPGASAEAALAPVPSPSHLSLRHFRPGATLAYSYVIYNPRLERADARPRLTTQARLFRGGREILTTPETPFDAGAQTDASRLNAGGTLTLPADAPHGSYLLQIVVNDGAPGKRRQTATQWIDFEIVK